MTIFGRIITDDQIEEAVIATLRKWVPTELAEVEEQIGIERGYYECPVESSYTARTDFDKWPEDMLPAITVITVGLEDDPPKDGEGRYRGSFGVGVAAIASSVDRLSTRRYAYRLGAAVRATLTHRQSLDLALGGTVRGVKLVGGRNNELPTEDDRTIWASRQMFMVEVGNFLTEAAGPPSDADPLPDPTEPWPDDVVVQPTPRTLLEPIPR